MIKPPHFSLILATLNGMPNIPRALDAVQRQTFDDFEVIIQDGGSTDGTLEYLSDLDLPYLEVVSEPDSGIGQAYNRAMRRARGTLVVALACDEWLEANALERFRSWHDDHPNAAFVYGGCRFWRSADEVHSELQPGNFDLYRY